MNCVTHWKPWGAAFLLRSLHRSAPANAHNFLGYRKTLTLSRSQTSGDRTHWRRPKGPSLSWKIGELSVAHPVLAMCFFFWGGGIQDKPFFSWQVGKLRPGTVSWCPNLHHLLSWWLGQNAGTTSWSKALFWNYRASNPFPRSVPCRRSQPSSPLALGLPSYLRSRRSRLCPPGPAHWRPAGGRCRNRPGQGEPQRWSSSSATCSCRSRWWRRHRRSARGTGSRCARRPARPASRGSTRRWPAPPQPAVRPAAAAGVKWRSRRRQTGGVRPTWHSGARAALLPRAQCRLRVNRGLRDPGPSGVQARTSLLSVSSAAFLRRPLPSAATSGSRRRRSAGSRGS